MTRFANQSLAAFFAVFLALTSIGTIVTVPEASAHATHPAAPFAQPVAELA
ncbi:MAG: hypothetical protein ACX930_11765 [Erythrobacter sp.]